MIISIDGNTGVGKTTLYNHFIVNGFVGLKEYSFYVKDDLKSTFPKFPPTTVEDIIKSHSLWASVETLRLNSLESSFSDTVLDRSFLSIFAFEWAKMHLGYLYEFKELATLYIKLLDSNKLVVPDAMLHLQTDYDHILKYRRDLVMPFLYDPNTVALIDAFMEKYGKVLYGAFYYSIVNTNKSVDGLLQEVDHLIFRTVIPKVSKSLVRGLLEDFKKL